MLTKIIHRNGTTAEWAASDIVLDKGEVGIEFLTDGIKKQKIGDGIKKWSELEYDSSSLNVSIVNKNINSFTLSDSITLYDSTFEGNVSFRFVGVRDTIGSSYLSIGLEKVGIRFGTNTTTGNRIYINDLVYDKSFFVGNVYDFVISYNKYSKICNLYVNGVLIHCEINVTINEFGNIKCNHDAQCRNMQLLFLQKFNCALSEEDVIGLNNGGNFVNTSGLSNKYNYIGDYNKFLTPRYGEINSSNSGVGSVVKTTDGYSLMTAITGSSAVQGYTLLDLYNRRPFQPNGFTTKIHVRSGDFPIKIKLESSSDFINIFEPGIYECTLYNGFDCVYVESGKSIELKYQTYINKCISSYAPYNKNKAFDLLTGNTIQSLNNLEYLNNKIYKVSVLPTSTNAIGDIYIVNGEIYMSNSLTTFKKISI